MARPPSRTVLLLKQGIAIAGFLAFAGGVYWTWQLRASWPRAAGDPIPKPLMEAVGVIVGGLYFIRRNQ